MATIGRFGDTGTALRRLDRDIEVGKGAKQGAAWLASAQVVAQALQFAFSIINARLLYPADFGLAAVALAVVFFAASLSQFGLGAALIQEDAPTNELAATAFWLTAGTAWIIAAGIALLAAPLGAMLGGSGVRPLLYLAAATIAASVSVVQIALLERTFNFRFIAYANLAGAALGLIVVPLSAVSGLGAYSLMLGPLVQVAVTTCLLWYFTGWIPTSGPTRAASTHLWRYSRGIGGFNILSSVSRGIDSVALSRVAGPTALGQYSRALNLTSAPVQQMQQAVDRSLFPALARLKSDPNRMGEAWFRGITAAGGAVLPVSVTLIVTAPSLVATLYGPRWIPMVPILELLALATVPQMLTAASGAVYRAADQTGRLFKSACWSALATCVAVLIGVRWGARGVAVALAVKFWLDVWLFVVPVFRFAPIRRSLAISALTRMLVPSVALAAVELAVRIGIPDLSPQQMLGAQLVAGGLAYVVAIRTVFPTLWSLAVTRASRGRFG